MFSTSPTAPIHVALGLAAGQRFHQSGNDTGAAHIPFHVIHAGGRLEGNTAGIETDPLADKGNRLRAFLLGCRQAVPFHHHHLAFARTSIADGQQRSHAKLAHLRFAENGDLDAELGQIAFQALREFGRVQNVRRLRHQIACEIDAFGNLREIGVTRACRSGTFASDRQ